MSVRAQIKDCSPLNLTLHTLHSLSIKQDQWVHFFFSFTAAFLISWSVRTVNIINVWGNVKAAEKREQRKDTKSLKNFFSHDLGNVENQILILTSVYKYIYSLYSLKCLGCPHIYDQSFSFSVFPADPQRQTCDQTSVHPLTPFQSRHINALNLESLGGTHSADIGALCLQPQALQSSCHALQRSVCLLSRVKHRLPKPRQYVYKSTEPSGCDWAAVLRKRI